MINQVKKATRRLLINNCSYFREYFYRKDHVGRLGLVDLFDEKKCIFIHVPKCAGMTITMQLYGLQIGHATYADWSGIIPCSLEKYFSFSVLREPAERFCSAYYFLKSGGMHELDREVAERELSEYETLSELVDALEDRVVRERIFNILHFRPQYLFISDSRGSVKLDLLIPLEYLSQGFERLFEKTNIRLNPIRLNKTRAKKSVLSEQELTRVRHYYHRDCTLYQRGVNRFLKG